MACFNGDRSVKFSGYLKKARICDGVLFMVPRNFMLGVLGAVV